MITKEFEKKLLLSEIEYAFVRKLFFYGKKTLYTEHVNYYYDTPSQEFLKQGTTCRVRQKDGVLKGTIKTHLLNKRDESTEDDFTIDTLPYRFLVSGKEVRLQGSLYTRRFIVELMPGINLMLDQNWYLGICDYELEIEYSAVASAEAEGVFETFVLLLNHKKCDTEQLSKSKRFLLRKEQLPSYSK